MNQKVNLAEARKKLPELTDSASSGNTYVISRRGRELAVIMGINEYQHLKALETQQRRRDFDILLSPALPDDLTEEDARELAVETTHEVRRQRSTNMP